MQDEDIHEEIPLNNEPTSNGDEDKADPLQRAPSDPLAAPPLSTPPSIPDQNSLPQHPLFPSGSTSGPTFSPRDDPQPAPGAYLGPLSDSVLDNVDLGDDGKAEVDVGAAMAAAGTDLTQNTTGTVEPSTRPASKVRIEVADPVKRVSVR